MQTKKKNTTKKKRTVVDSELRREDLEMKKTNRKLKSKQVCKQEHRNRNNENDATAKPKNVGKPISATAARTSKINRIF